ncbi:hypothetical protein STAS_26814 [Striga asiatica]|uniref:Uncharacterized protein n=1 Tax=Striga asiatica TaxID=4170 RepID=A0A5A7QYT1_STRAF|nr:hypothetical protein STAS_26814 [Striga asiatica]
MFSQASATVTAHLPSRAGDERVATCETGVRVRQLQGTEVARPSRIERRAAADNSTGLRVISSDEEARFATCDRCAGAAISVEFGTFEDRAAGNNRQVSGSESDSEVTTAELERLIH